MGFQLMAFSRKIRYLGQTLENKEIDSYSILFFSENRFHNTVGLEKSFAGLPRNSLIIMKNFSNEARVVISGHTFFFRPLFKERPKIAKMHFWTINWIHLIIQNLTRKEVIEFTNFIHKKCNSKVPSFLLTFL